MVNETCNGEIYVVLQRLDADRVGGYQRYCCTGFVPSPNQNTDDLTLIGRNLLKRNINGLSRRDSIGSSLTAGVAACVATVNAAIILAGTG